MTTGFEILPPRGLDQSILVVVLVGIWVLLAFREWFGWAFVGLVVPGYLASVFIIAPASGITIAIESILTYLIAKFVSDQISRLDAWNPFFGRDRFLFIVLVSVLVRQASELWFLSFALGNLDQLLGTDFYSRQDFYSIGLVLVPLTANMFWKLNLRSGIGQIGTPVLVTYLLVHFLVLPLTNLSFSMMELTYEDSALDFLGSSKAYIILLTSAFLAARFNLHLGWDYNGILVPSLLALAWFDPRSVFVSVIEALVLAAAATLILLIPTFKTVNLEGPRKTVLVFTIGFILKFILGWGVWLSGLGVEVPDLYGFGYVLTSLIAVKIVSKRVVGRIIFPVVVVSGAGFMLGNALGLGLERAAPDPIRKPSVERVMNPSQRLTRDRYGIALLAQSRTREWPSGWLASTHRNRWVSEYEKFWIGVSDWLKDQQTEPPKDLHSQAELLGLSITPLTHEPGAFGIFETSEVLQDHIGLESAFINPQGTGPIIHVPNPTSKPESLLASVELCNRVDCQALLFSGIDYPARQSPKKAFNSESKSTYSILHNVFMQFPSLQIQSDAFAMTDKAIVHVRSVNAQLNLNEVWHTEVELSWDPPPNYSKLWARSRNLQIIRANRESLLANTNLALQEYYPLETKDLALYDPTLYQPNRANYPSETELRAYEILLLELYNQRKLLNVGSYARLNRLFKTLDLSVYKFGADKDTIWITKPLTALGQSFGTTAIRSHGASNIAITVPRPYREPGTYESASQLWSMTEAVAFGVSPILDKRGARSATQSIHQSFHRMVQRTNSTIFQIRGLSSSHGIESDLVLGLGVPFTGDADVPTSLKPYLGLEGALTRLAGEPIFVDGDRVPYELSGSTTSQIRFSQSFGGADSIITWISRNQREQLLMEAAQ